MLDLEANGIRMIQIDEAALREKLPLRRSDWDTEYLDFAIPAFRLTHSGVRPETQIHTHMCYSVEEIVQVLEKMLTQIEPDKLWVNPDCGLKTRGIPETEASLINMVQAAKQIRVAHSK